MSKKVLLRCKYMHDGFLWRVLAKYQGQFVVWDYNDQTEGFSSGHYLHSYGDALLDYVQSISESSLLNLSHIQFRDFEGHWAFQDSNSANCLTGYISNQDISADMITKMFGEPDAASGDGYKVSIEWCGRIEGYNYRIYNYKDGKSYLGNEGLEINELRDWHISGDKTIVPHLINHAVEKELNGPTE